MQGITSLRDSTIDGWMDGWMYSVNNPGGGGVGGACKLCSVDLQRWASINVKKIQI